MDSDIGAGASEDQTLLSSPHFDAAATSMAHPVVPLDNVSENTPPRRQGIGMLDSMRRVPPAFLVAAFVLVAAAMVAAATALYKYQQPAIAPSPSQLSDSIVPGRSSAGEDAPGRNTIAVEAPKRRLHRELDTPPAAPPLGAADQAKREEAIGTIRQILTEQIRSRGKHDSQR